LKKISSTQTYPQIFCVCENIHFFPELPPRILLPNLSSNLFLCFNVVLPNLFTDWSWQLLPEEVDGGIAKGQYDGVEGQALKGFLLLRDQGHAP